MTSPDMNFPSGAYTSSTVFSQQSVTQASVGQSQAADMKTLLDQMQATFINNLLGGFGNVVGAIGAAINKFISDLVFALKNVTGGFVDLTGFLKQTETKATDAQTAANAVAGTANTANANAAAATIIVQQVKSQVLEIADNIPIVDPWISMIPGQQVTFPYGLLTTDISDLLANGTAGAGRRVVYGNASGDGGSFSLSYRDTPGYTPAINTIEGAYILSKYPGGRAVIQFAVDAVASPAPMYVYVGRMLANGTIQINWVSPNQTPLMTNARQEWFVTMPTELVFDYGEWMVVMVHQFGSGNPRFLFGKERPDIPRNSSFFPPQQKFHLASSSLATVSTQITPIQQLTTSRWLPWFGIGLNLNIGDAPPRNMADDFERANTANGLGTASWVSAVKVGAQQMIISNGKACFGGTSDGEERHIWYQPLNYDVLTGKVQITDLTAQYSKWMFKSNSANTAYLFLRISTAGVGLFRQIDGVSTTQLGGYAGALSNLGWIYLTVGKDVNGKEVYVVRYRTDAQPESAAVALFSFTEATAGAVGMSGPQYRYHGMGTARGGFTDSADFCYYDIRDDVEVTT